MSKLSHTDEQGKANMVDVGHKTAQIRIAVAKGFISLNADTVELIRDNKIKKGDVLTVAEIAGIQASKQTSSLIPLCHPLNITKSDVKCLLTDKGVEITAQVKCIGQTGVEMEALTAVSVGLLTIYDMCKAADKNMIISKIQLISKIKTDLKEEH
jgi:cyclic pyranopterin monophosphate synthase